MKLLVVFLFVAAAAAFRVDQRFVPRHVLPTTGTPRADARAATWETIEQKQDNFDSNNQNTFSMRYVSNDQFFKPGGPIFIMLGIMWTVDEVWVRNGQMFDMAEIHNAQLYTIEPRYFGESYPTEDLTTENLRFLSPEQALADVAHFIETIKTNNPNLANSKVVVFGGSHGGTLATWMRQKYPNLVHAAVASSAPLLATVDFSGYHEIVKSALGESCSSILMNASKEIRRLISTGFSSKVERDFRVCSPFKSDYDVQALFWMMASQIGSEIQFAGPSTVNEICTKLSNPNVATDYLRVADYFSNSFCMPGFEDTIAYVRDPSLHMGDGRQWYYQTCSSFGYFQTAWDKNSLYNLGISDDFYMKQCQELFGEKFTPEFIAEQIAQTNSNHGGLKPNVDRVISVQGSVDPWSPLGLTADSNPRAPVYVVKGSSHCADMLGLGTWNSPELRDAKQAVVKFIASWLEESD